MKKLVLLTMLVLSACYTAPVTSHSFYHHECCHDYDCSPIVKETVLPNGDMEITNKNGHTAIFPKGHPVRSSQDEKDHACINPTTLKPLCLYRGAGV